LPFPPSSHFTAKKMWEITWTKKKREEKKIPLKIINYSKSNYSKTLLTKAEKCIKRCDKFFFLQSLENYSRKLGDFLIQKFYDLVSYWGSIKGKVSYFFEYWWWDSDGWLFLISGPEIIIIIQFSISWNYHRKMSEKAKPQKIGVSIPDLPSNPNLKNRQNKLLNFFL
jgi:hypothetical protein